MAARVCVMHQSCNVLFLLVTLSVWWNGGISLAKKEPQATVQDVQRSLEGGGAHRQLHTLLTISLQDWPAAATQECDIVLLEKLPKSVFADSFELQGLQRRGVFKRAHVFGDTNLEQPASRSSECIVEIQAPTSKSHHHHDEFRLQTRIKLPLHARYPAVSKDSHSAVHIPLPEVSVQCTNPRDKGGPLGQHIQVAWGHKLPEAPVWRIPAGNPTHRRFVSFTTAIAAVLGVLFLLVASVLAYSQIHPISVHDIGRKLHLL